MEKISSLFRFTWPRGLMLSVAVAVGFLVPQGVPLEYASLNNPSSGLQYLEMTCASNVAGSTGIFLDFGRGFNELEKIQIPIGPSETAYTYTFPLLDAPLMGMRIDPFERGAGELTIRNFRIINRRGEEILRFAAADFLDLHQMRVTRLSEGWKLTTDPASEDPRAAVHLSRAVVAEGMNERNAKRCLISAGYLTMMLWILLLAVYFTFWEQRPVSRCLGEITFLVVIALLFSLVGNRGLIKNSMRYAGASLYLPQAPTADKPAEGGLFDGLTYLEITYATTAAGVAQFYLDFGHGLNEREKLQLALVPDGQVRTYTLPLPDTPLQALRFDPGFPGSGQMDVMRFRIVDRLGAEIRRTTASDFQAVFPTDSVVVNSDRWTLVGGDVARGPQFWVKFGQPVVPVGFNRRDALRRWHVISGPVLPTRPL